MGRAMAAGALRSLLLQARDIMQPSGIAVPSTSVRCWYSVATSSQPQQRQGQYRDQTFPVYNLHRQEVGSYNMPGEIFDVPIRRDILQRVVRWQLAKRQQGTHKAKTRAEVRGGGRKPWKQKGLGKARSGSIRAPQFRGGGAVFGPVPRSHAHDLNKKVRRLGLLTALSAKAAEGRLQVVDTLALNDHKTKLLDAHLDTLLQRRAGEANAEARRQVLMIDSGKTAPDGGVKLRLAAANLPWVDVLTTDGANVYSILQRDNLLMTQDAVERLVERLRNPIKR